MYVLCSGSNSILKVGLTEHVHKIAADQFLGLPYEEGLFSLNVHDVA